MVIITLASIIFAYFVFSEKSAYTMWETLPVDYFTGKLYGPVFLVGLFLFLPSLFLVRMDVWQRIIAAKSEKSAWRGLIFAGIGALFFYVLFTTLGMWAKSIGTGKAEYATLSLLFTVIGQSEIYLAILISAFIAAIVSSADTFMNNASLSMSYLIWRKKWTQEGGISSEKNLTTYTRIAGLILLLGSILLAYHFRDIVDLLVGAFSLLLLFLPAICGMLTKKMYSEAGAFWSSLIGSILFIPTFFVTPKNAFVPCVILSFIIYYSITIYQNKREKDK